MTNRAMEPPEHLSADSKKWWRSIVTDFYLEAHHVRLLQGCCESWDRAETARRRVAKEGVFVEDRFGKPKAHPGVDVERKARDQFRFLLRELGLDVSAPGDARAPALGANSHLRIN